MPSAFKQAVVQGSHKTHVATQGLVVRQLHGELDRCHDGRCGHGTKAVGRHAQHIDHQGDAATWPYIGRCTATGDIHQGFFHGTGELNRVVGDARAQAATRTTQEQHRHHRGFAVLANAVNHLLHLSGHGCSLGLQMFIQHKPSSVLAGG